MKKIIALWVCFITANFLLAHEFWLQPEKFIYQQGENVNATFLVGENFTGENWTGNRQRIKSLQLHLGSDVDDIADLIGDEKGDSIQLMVMNEGTVMMTFNNHNSFIELEAQKFTDYLKEDGLEDAINYREQNGEKDSIGREFYQRSVKTIFQVGKKYTDVYKKETDLPIDILLQSNPYELKKNGAIKTKILFQGKALKNALCKIWHRYNDKTTMQELSTDSNGELSIEIEPTGRWMVSTVKMVRLQNDSKAQWQSYWGSATWGYY